ncbi:MAG: glycosyltransferase [Phycisphaerae bacterium]|nr:glycosyltransferase [Phycisphaerae bacterium]
MQKMRKMRKGKMKVFMLGWEFPPFISGGLGTACYGITKGLDEVGVEVCFVLPTAVPVDSADSGATDHITLRTPSDLILPDDFDDGEISEETRRHIECKLEHLTIHQLDAILQPYASEVSFEIEMLRLNRQVRSNAAKEILRKVITDKRHSKDAKKQTAEQAAASAAPKAKTHKDVEQQSALPHGSLVKGGAGEHYDGDLMGQIHRYARLAVELSEGEDFDVIHAHDWMTFPAGMAVAAASGKPLVVHVHSTEFDRAGANVNQRVYDIERSGMHAAARVVCVSHLTKNIAIHRYGVNAEKVTVVYNAVELTPDEHSLMKPISRDEKIVLFLGRITMQKGPEYFLEAAKKVIQKYTNVRFVIAGSGDMVRKCIQLAADLKLGKYVTFTGFLRGQDVDRIFKIANLYVMPSVSEPFGIAPLEAMSHNVPVIISKQSGVSEVLTHVLKVDFWDTDEMANKILAVLRHEPLQRTLSQHSQFELQKLSWNDSAVQLKEIYSKLIE